MGEKAGGLYYGENAPKGEGLNKIFNIDENGYDFLSKMYNDLDKNLTNVTEAQQLLTDVDYWDGPLDGHYSADFDGALKRYILNVNDESLVLNMLKDEQGL